MGAFGKKWGRFGSGGVLTCILHEHHKCSIEKSQILPIVIITTHAHSQNVPMNSLCDVVLRSEVKIPSLGHGSTEILILIAFCN